MSSNLLKQNANQYLLWPEHEVPFRGLCVWPLGLLVMAALFGEVVEHWRGFVDYSQLWFSVQLWYEKQQPHVSTVRDSLSHHHALPTVPSHHVLPTVSSSPCPPHCALSTMSPPPCPLHQNKLHKSQAKINTSFSRCFCKIFSFVTLKKKSDKENWCPRSGIVAIIVDFQNLLYII